MHWCSASGWLRCSTKRQRFMQGVSYSVRSACMGSMEAARRAGIMAAIKPETASKAQTDRIVIGSCRPTPKRNA